MPLNNPALVLIDIQQGFDDPLLGTRNNPHAEDKVITVLNFFRQHKLPIIHIKHNSLNPSSPLYPKSDGNEIKNIAKPLKEEPLLTKSVNCAFWGSSLKKVLDKNKIKHIVLCGFTTDHCVSTTARSGANLGFKITVLSDATATFSRKSSIGGHAFTFPANIVHELALASLNEEFAEIIETAQLIKRLKNKIISQLNTAKLRLATI